PTPIRFQVHRTQLPLPQRVVDAGVESSFLFLLVDLEPYFYQHDPGVDNVAFSGGANRQKMFMLMFVYKPHHVFDACPVVPTSIENDDLPGGRKVCNVALNIHLAFFTISRRRQSDDTKNARTYSFRDGLDCSALAGRITALK